MTTHVMVANSVGSDVMSEAGFVAAVRAIHPALRRYARRLAHDEAGGEDLVQDALASAWRARAQFEPDSNFQAWLFRILRNRFLSGARRAWRTVSWDMTVDDRKLISAADQETALLFGDLERALESLPSGHAEALLLVTRDGLTYDDAAVQLGVPVGTIRSRVHRARLAVVDYLSNAKIASESDTGRALLEGPAGGLDVYAQWKRSGSRMIG